jgi:hypothetical protein
LQLQQDGDEVPGLVAAGHVVGLVLHPHIEPERVRQPAGALERRHPEPGRGDRFHGFVGVADQLVARLGLEPALHGEAAPRQLRPVRQERVRRAGDQLGGTGLRRCDRRGGRHDGEGVVAVVGSRRRAAPRRRLTGIDLGATDAAAVAHRHPARLLMTLGPGR